MTDNTQPPEPEDRGGQIMDLAVTSDQEALLGGVQAALSVVTDLIHGHPTQSTDQIRQQAYSRILRALQDGGPYGSPTQLAGAARREAEHKAGHEG